MSSRGGAAPDRPAWTAIGRAHGRHRTFLIATCAALVLAAIGDEATGYDGPVPAAARHPVGPGAVPSPC